MTINYISISIFVLGTFALIAAILYVAKNGIQELFELLANAINGSERAFIDLLSAIVPYAVPVIPAFLTYYHTSDPDLLNFPKWVAWTAAFVVETLGMASVSTAIKFWRNNQRYTSDQNKAPFGLAIGTYIAYLVIVIVVNVILEILAEQRNGWLIVTIALFSLLSVPSGVLISIRAQYRDILDERQSRRSPKPVASEDKPKAEKRDKFASHFKPKIINMLEKEYGTTGKILQPREITAKLNLDHEKSKGYVSTTTTNWMKEKGIQRPPKDGNSPLTY